MQYQLVLQVPADSLEGFDALLEFEDRLISELAGAGDVDGHDFGSGEINFFIITANPNLAFERCVDLLSHVGLLHHVVAAYRSLNSDEYSVVWPKTFHGEFNVA
ncbi:MULTISPECIES: hypothetical protein [unclassified Duganella]|uniref:hypothetical protein n=1 Tax=unclassified Duganella TaxID=2636909 RepID=UPI0006F4A520|nr:MULTISPECIES: hypothetical protein [unclassified Duganella]KQV54991.1 hypothetical protein ASD07_28905 [Duganella sp. Root336D2]KRB93204.1 hypothetical protein ASE26_28465 [Duganella sp. Root198D2]